MTTITGIEVDPFDPLLTASESLALQRMMARYLDLLDTGRIERAREAGRMIHIFWQTLRGFIPHLGDSNHGDLT